MRLNFQKQFIPLRRESALKIVVELSRFLGITSGIKKEAKRNRKVIPFTFNER
jgi:hypothetical protein